MKQADIRVGCTYAVKVSGKLQPVTIIRPTLTTAYGTYASASVYGSRYGRPKTMSKFIGKNEWTGRTIGPFTAAKCRVRLEKDRNNPTRWRRADNQVPQNESDNA